MTAQEVLLKAAELLECEGWSSGPGDLSGARCAGLAIDRVARTTLELDAATDHLAGYLGLAPSTSTFGAVTAWNDAPNRTAAEVIAALRAAAQAAE